MITLIFTSLIITKVDNLYFPLLFIHVLYPFNY